jgi:protein-tyrosine phosphatase
MPVAAERSQARLALQTLFNARDLGGFRTVDGRMTAFGRFVRADAPVRLNSADLCLLLDYPVRTVIDLRSQSEIQALPHNLNGQPAVAYHNIPLLGNDLEAEISAVRLYETSRERIGVGLPDLYIHMLKQSQAQLGLVFRQLAEARDGACLFNCTHGKDRTGLVAALLLSLAGVSGPDIISDYQVSSTYLKPWFDTFIGTIPVEILHFFRTDPENMEITLAYFHQHFGTAEEYLTGSGLSRLEIQVLKNRLLN